MFLPIINYNFVNSGKFTEMKKFLLLKAAAIFAVSIFLSPEAAGITESWIESNYTKREVMISMRDGVKLYTAIYEPVRQSPADPDGMDEERPIIMLRTPYSCSPYGEGFTKSLRQDMRFFAENRYIIVFQNVRGRYMSEGKYENIRPFNPHKTGRQTDEASDTYDTVEWLLENTCTNGNVGVTGVSYPGFYAIMAALSGHPAIKAVSPQAPVFDWYMGDDAHHNGVLMLLDTYSFGGSMYRDQDNPSVKSRGNAGKIRGDAYSFFLEKATMENITATFKDSLVFWHQIMEHPDYDAFWKERTPGRHLRDIMPAVLVVGGTFDTDDCYGALQTYGTIRSQSPDTPLHLVYGPWYHGGWHNTSYTHLGHVWFGEGLSEYFMKNIEYPFFRHYLEGKGDAPAPVTVFPSGGQSKREYRSWPPEHVSCTRLYLRQGDSLSFMRPDETESFSSYVSDPQKPVPHIGFPIGKRTREYMVEDQRFASARPDVLTFVTPPLEDTLKLEGPVSADIFFRTTGSDADIVVKLVDVYPADFEYDDEVSEKMNVDGYQMGGYQMLVRGDIFRARYRESYENPVPLKPDETVRIEFDMDDVAHWFLPGHRVMVQIQSTWFPIADRNPQKFVRNIYKAAEDDFRAEEMTVWHQKDRPSCIMLPVVE